MCNFIMMPHKKNYTCTLIGTHIVLYLFISIALLTSGAFQKHSRPRQLTLQCQSLDAEALQGTASKELAQRSLRDD